MGLPPEGQDGAGLTSVNPTEVRLPPAGLPGQVGVAGLGVDDSEALQALAEKAQPREKGGGSDSDDSGGGLGRDPGSDAHKLRHHMSRAGCFVQSNLEDNFPESATGGEAMKSLASRSRKLIMKDQNNSIFARVAGDFAFQQAILVVVVLNAIWICLDVELNHDALKKDGKKPLEPYSTVIENCFCVLFFTELVIRFLAYQHKRTCLKDVWFMFDGALVFFMILEVWMLPLYQDVFSSGGDSDGLSNFSSFRLLRLLRLTRMARIMRFVPELMVLVKSTVQAMQSVGFILLFLLLCTFVFALVFTSLLGTGTDDCGGLDARRLSRLLSGDYVEEVEDEDPNAHQLFCTLFSSMMTLFTNGVLQDNLAQTLAPVKEDNLALFWCFVVFECIASITLLNMLIGVLCQVITQTYEREGNIRRNKRLQEALEQAFKAADKSMDGMISEEEWKEMSADGVVRSTCFALFPSLDESQLDMQLQKLEMTLFKQDKQMRHGGTKDVLSTSSMKSAASLIKKEPKTVEFERFVEQVIELRWDTAASILDVENLASHVLAEDKRLRDKMSGIEGQVAKALEARGLAACGEPTSPAACSGPRPGAPVASSAPKPWKRVGPASWLQDVPTELLFHALKARPSMTSN